MKKFKTLAIILAGLFLFTSMSDKTEEGDKLIGVWEPSNKKIYLKRLYEKKGKDYFERPPSAVTKKLIKSLEAILFQ